jgi:tetratricopeptide (TPR) repeat protein
MGNLPMIVDNLTVSGLLCLGFGNHPRNFELTTEGFKIARSIGNIWNLFSFHTNQVLSFREQGDFMHALKHLEEMKLVSDEMSKAHRVFVHIYSALMFTELGLVDEGLEECRQFLEFETDKILSMFRVSDFVHTIEGRLYLQRGDLESAQEAIRTIGSEPSDVSVFPYIVRFILSGVCEVLRSAEEYHRLVEMSEECISQLENSGLQGYLPDFYYNLGLGLVGKGNLSKGLEALSKARSIAQDVGLRRILWQILAAMADVVEVQGDALEANTLRNQAREVVNYLANNIGDDVLKDSFQSIPAVHELLERE